MSGEWRVRLPCPQCAAPVDLDAGDPVFRCGYCRTGLYLASSGPLRYRMAPGGEPVEEADRLYLPFWRIRGVRYRMLASPPSVEGRLLDATLPAYAEGLPEPRLGIRPQVAPLRLDAPGGEVLAVDRPAQQALRLAEDRAERLHDRPPLLTRLVGERTCLLLVPCRLERQGDGWRLRELLPGGEAHPVDPARAEALRGGRFRGRATPAARFLPLLCPECGSDLPAAPGAAALVCGRCARAWWARGAGYAPLPYAVCPASGTDVRHFPFWQIAFRPRGLPAANRAELRRWAVSYQPVPPGWERQPCQVFVPAFQLPPSGFLRLARAISLAPLEVPSASGGLPGRFDGEPVRLPLPEAVQALQVTLAHLARGARDAFETVASAELRVRRARLVYLPFRRGRREWIEEATGTALPIASVEHGARL
ncbi:MAG: hypothetical protein Kow0092_16890 [Deferrisomatales bacterium]